MSFAKPTQGPRSITLARITHISYVFLENLGYCWCVLGVFLCNDREIVDCIPVIGSQIFKGGFVVLDEVVISWRSIRHSELTRGLLFKS